MKRLSLVILASFILILLFGCSGGGGSSSGSYTTQVKITVGKTSAAFSEIEGRLRASNQIPASVSQIRFTISAPDMQTITRMIQISGQSTITESFDVPVGASRRFLVESLDAQGNVIFRGEAIVDIGVEAVTLSISLENTDPVSPVFSGLLTITQVTNNSMVLNWSAATDNVTDQDKMTYLIYMATSSGGQDFTNPTFAVSGGAASYTVTNLNPGATYYFVVRAMDGHGNVDGNSVERSATTLSTIDTIPPVFNGLSSITNITATTMVLNWSPATDNVTPQGKIRYLIYAATSRAGENFTTPTFTSSAGDTSYMVTNLSPSTTYYFVVRAMDESGNIDANTVERSATTAAATYTHTISGRITTASGAALAGVYVTLSGTATSTAVTDASGNYSFSGRINGSYTVTPYLTNYTFSPTSTPVTVNGADVPGVNFTGTANPVIPDTYAISGTVTYNGSGLAGVTVTISGAAAGTATTDAAGSYSFAGLANGSYTLTPSLSGYSFSPTSTPVTVNGANVANINFAATIPSAYNISGTVTFGGVGMAGVSVTLSGGATATTTTDASGNYSFTGLANGSYTVTPYVDGYYFTYASYPYTLGSADVTVSGADLTAVNFTATVVPIYSTISGTITTSDGATLMGATVTLSGAASATTTTDTAGNYTFTGLSNGSYTVTPSLSGYTFTPASAPVTVDNANVTGVNFIAAIIPIAHIISGTITDDGDPVPGVTVTLSGDASSSTTTNISGFYSFFVFNGNYLVTPSSMGYAYSPASRSVTVSDANVTGLDFSQSAVATYTISGTVADPYYYGRSGVTISVTAGGVPVTSAVTDTSGYYSCSGLANGTYVLTPSYASGYSFTPTSSTRTVAGADITGVNFTISP